MRKRIKTGPSEASVDLTPMLDVVFILLIFFIVTSTFIQEKTLGLEPPPPPVLIDPPPHLAVIVYLDQDDLIRVNGQLTLLDGVSARMERYGPRIQIFPCCFKRTPGLQAVWLYAYAMKPIPPKLNA